MSELWRNVRFGVRVLRGRPTFTVVAVLSLVLGVGVNTAIFSLLDDLFLRPFPGHDPDRLVSIRQTWRNEAGKYADPTTLARPNYVDYREQTTTLEDLSLSSRQEMALTGGDLSERIIVLFVTANYLDLLGLQTSRGRFISPEEDLSPGSHPVAVLSHGCWSRLFGADPEVVGKTIRLNGRSLTIIGVGPEGFRGTEIQVNVDVMVPTMMFPVLSPFGQYFDARDASVFDAIGRLKPGVTIRAAEAELNRLSLELSSIYLSNNDSMGIEVTPLSDRLLPEQFRAQYVAYGKGLILGVGLLLLIACLNVATLLLVRGLERGRELAVRQAVGASRWRVVYQLLTESVLLFLVGAVLSLPVAHGTLILLWRYRPPEFAVNAVGPTLHPLALGFALALGLVTGLISGLVPALRVSRLEPSVCLKQGGIHPPSKHWRGLRIHPQSLLVVLQVALTLVAVIGAGLFQRSLQNLQKIDLGFQPEHLAVIGISPGEQGLDEAEGRRFYQRLLDGLSAVPGVESVALSENRLLRGAVLKYQVYPDGDEIAVDSPIGSRHRTNAVSPEFFSTVGIPLILGRDFNGFDTYDGSVDSEQHLYPRVVIINETMAQMLWPGENPIGRRIHFDYPNTPSTEVVGVAKDSSYRNLREDPQFFLYIPLAEMYKPSTMIHVRTAGDPAEMLPVLRKELQRIQPGLVPSEMGTMGDFIELALWTERMSAIALGIFGVLALVLAMVGIYGVVSYAAGQRRREMAIRRALGAQRGEVLRQILIEGAWVVGLGVAVGWVLSYVLQNLIADMLYKVEIGEPVVFFRQALLMVLVACVSTLIPALRALRMHPMKVLRNE